MLHFRFEAALEIAQRYHHNAHRGLHGATPYSMWATLGGVTPPRLLPDTVSEALRFLIQFRPMTYRTIQADGLTLFYIRYWHPIFAAWCATKQKVITRFHPEDLSKIFVSVDGKQYLEVTFADLRRERVSSWEQRSALRHLRAQGQRYVSEAMPFATIRIVARARSQTLGASRRGTVLKDLVPRNFRQETAPVRKSDSALEPAEASIDYSKSAPAFHVEQW